MIVLSERAKRLLDADRQIEAKVRRAVRRMGERAEAGAAGEIGETPEQDLVDRLIARLSRL